MCIRDRCLAALTISCSVKIRLVIKVNAITIIIIGLTNPAFTAASPKIRAPSIDMALP